MSNKTESKTPVQSRVTVLEEETLELLATVGQQQAEVEDYYPRIVVPEVRDELEGEVEATVESLKRSLNNMRQAYAQTFDLSDELQARFKDLERSEKKRRIIPVAPANSLIDMEEKAEDHFAQGINIYKVLWICFIGSFAGVVVELLWCLFRNGYLESRAGLVYGPFNLLYGAGAVALSLALYQYRNRSGWISFAGGMAVGSVLEYLCSWAQEMLIGSRSWDYSGMPFNLNGRICLLYSVFWGFLGILWIKDLYPRMAKWILKVPNRWGKGLTWVLTVFFVVNAAVSCVSVYRWSQRVQGVEPSSPFWQAVDERFPNERMERIFANMKFE